MKFKVGDRVWSEYFDSEGVVARIYDRVLDQILVRFVNTTARTRELLHGNGANEWVYYADGGPIELCEDEGIIIHLAYRGKPFEDTQPKIRPTVTEINKVLNEDSRGHKLDTLAEAMGLPVGVVAEAIVHVAKEIK